MLKQYIQNEKCARRTAMSTWSTRGFELKRSIQQSNTTKQNKKTSYEDEYYLFFCLAWIEDITIAQLETVTHIV